MINLTYQAVTPDEVSLLAEQKRFVFSVLEQTVLTPDGMLHVHTHSDSGDATKVYADLIDRYGRATAAQLAATELEEDISTFWLDSTWKSPILPSWWSGPPRFLTWIQS